MGRGAASASSKVQAGPHTAVKGDDQEACLAIRRVPSLISGRRYLVARKEILLQRLGPCQSQARRRPHVMIDSA